MQVGTLVLSVVCATVGVFAGRATRSSPPAAVAATPASEPSPVVPHHVPTLEVAAPSAEVHDDGDDGDDGEDIGEALAGAKLLAEHQLHEREAIRGQVTNSRDGTPIAGCTVIAVGLATGAQTAITDEHGNYEIIGLDPATYTVTIYFGEAVAETSGVATRSYEVTKLDLSLAYPPEREPDEMYIESTPDLPMRRFDSESFTISSGPQLENTYYVSDGM